MHDQYWQTEEASRGSARAHLARGERTATPRAVRRAQLRGGAFCPDLDEFVRQYRQAGGQISHDLEGEGEGL
jgi:hypothetical protein